RSTDSGVTFSNPVNLSKSPLTTLRQAIAVLKNNVYVSWDDSSTVAGPAKAVVPGEVFLAQSTDGGNAFDTPINISNNTSFSSTSQMAVSPSSNSLFVTWLDSTGKSEIFF